MMNALLGYLVSLSLLQPAQAAPAMHIVPVASTATPPKPPMKIPWKRNAERMGIETSGRAAFVADVQSGRVLFAKHPHDVHPIASLTKLMTAMVILDQHPDLNATLTFIPEDFDGEGKDVFAAGDTMTQGQALHALLIGSVNAAGNALARTLMERESFVKAMNQKAAEMQLKSPVFLDPTGVNPGNRANAADVGSMLTRALTYPEIRQITSQSAVQIKTVAGKDYEIKSTNLLFDSFLSKAPYQIIGGKTGSLPEAGFCMAQVTRNKEGHEIVAVTLGSENHFSRYQDVKALTAWAFETYEWSGE